jgi:hypothetical protein
MNILKRVSLVNQLFCGQLVFTGKIFTNLINSPELILNFIMFEWRMYLMKYANRQAGYIKEFLMDLPSKNPSKIFDAAKQNQ